MILFCMGKGYEATKYPIRYKIINEFSGELPTLFSSLFLYCADRENIIKIIMYTQMKISIYSSGLNRNRKFVGKYAYADL